MAFCVFPAHKVHMLSENISTKKQKQIRIKAILGLGCFKQDKKLIIESIHLDMWIPEEESSLL